MSGGDASGAGRGAMKQAGRRHTLTYVQMAGIIQCKCNLTLHPKPKLTVSNFTMKLSSYFDECVRKIVLYN